MAAKFGVLAPHANPAVDPPYRHVKRAAALLLIRKALAFQVGEYLIQELVIRAAESDPARFLLPEPYHFDGKVPDTLDRFDWSEPVLARYPAVDQTSYHRAYAADSGL